MDARPKNRGGPAVIRAPRPAETVGLPPELAHLLATARQELARHVRDHDRCAACGDTWPCERAVLAAFTLDAL